LQNVCCKIRKGNAGGLIDFQKKKRVEKGGGLPGIVWTTATRNFRERRGSIKSKGEVEGDHLGRLAATQREFDGRKHGQTWQGNTGGRRQKKGMDGATCGGKGKRRKMKQREKKGSPQNWVWPQSPNLAPEQKAEIGGRIKRSG